MKFSEKVAKGKPHLRVARGDIVFIDCVHYLPFWGGVCKLKPFNHEDAPLRGHLCKVVYGKFRDIENLDAKCEDRIRQDKEI